jgi:hypothetical protein
MAGRHYTIDGYIRRRGDNKNIAQAFVEDAAEITRGYPVLSVYGYNSPVIVKDAAGKVTKVIENPPSFYDIIKDQRNLLRKHRGIK